MKVFKTQAEFEEYVFSQKPTAQARLLGLELMDDKKPHNRQDIIKHIIDRGVELGLKPFSSGCISGGIQDIVAMPECEKLSSGTYKFTSSADSGRDIPLLEQSSRICEKALFDIRNIARKVDYITATPEEIKALEKLKECVNRLEDIIKLLDNTEKSL